MVCFIISFPSVFLKLRWRELLLIALGSPFAGKKQGHRILTEVEVLCVCVEEVYKGRHKHIWVVQKKMYRKLLDITRLILTCLHNTLLVIKLCVDSNITQNHPY